MTKATSIFRYPGGKSRKTVQQLILSYAPVSYSEYREVFCGGAGVFFGVDPTKKRWINDKSTDLIATYREVRDRYPEFIAACRAIPPAQDGDELIATSTGRLMNKRLHDKFYELLRDTTANPAVRFFFHNRTGFAGRVNYHPGLVQRTSFSNPDGWNIVKTNKLEMAAQQLQGVEITCRDFERVMMEPGEDVWVYADPPYMCDIPSAFAIEDNVAGECGCREPGLERRAGHAVG